jgi:hypothetical protein
MGSTQEYGAILIPQYVDDLAKQEPNRILYLIPRGAVVTDGFLTITTAIFANAVNRASWFLEKELGKSSTVETLGYIGPSESAQLWYQYLTKGI